MQGKVEKFHAGLNQTISHYVNKYGNDWNDFVDYASMVHRSTPHTITKFSPYYLLHGRDMRLPTMDDLSVRVNTDEADFTSGDPYQHARHPLAFRQKSRYFCLFVNTSGWVI